MKKKFTFLIAAMMLLMMVLPWRAVGQTRTTQTVVLDFENGESTTDWTMTYVTNSNTAISAYHGSKYSANNGSSAMWKYNTLIANPQSLTCYVSKTTTNTKASTWYIQVSSDGSTWQNAASRDATNMAKGEWVEFSADLSSYSDVYVQIKYDGSSAVRALDYITLVYDDGNTPSTDPEITIAPNSITLGDVLVGDQASTTFSVSQSNLTSGITLSVDNGSLSPSSIAQGAAATTVTWTYTPTTAGAISATVTATSGTTTETLAISGTAIAPVEGYDVDFEYATDMYPNWTFENMTTYQTGSITAHGGTYYGTTGGKATASITTTSTVANPGTLTCYVSKQSNNTSSSTWYIQVSENGSTWTDVESHSATSMSQGSWVEFTADLTDYTDVYVRVYYSGSTAIRNIDDLTLTTVEPSAGVATTTTINVPVNFNTDIYQGTTAGTLTATVTPEGGSALENPAITWSSSNTGVATIDANGAVTLVAVGTTTITASYAGIEDEYKPSTGTYELTVTNSNAPGTQNNPYTVAQAIAATPSSGNVYIQGIVSSFYNTSIVGDGNNFRYYISDDGGTTTQLLVYRGTGLNQATFTNADDLLVGDEVVIYGSLITYQNAPEVASGNYLYSWNRPTHPIINANDINLAYDAIEGSIAYTISNPTSATLTATSTADWISNITVGAEYVTFTTTANEGDADRSATITLSYTGAADKVITVTQAHYVPDYATLPFVWEGGSSADFAALNGVTLSGNGSDYNSNHAPYLIKLDGTGDYIQVKTDSQPGTVTIGVKMIGGADTSTITVQGSADGETFNDVEELTISGAQNEKLTLETSKAFAANVRYVRMLFNKGSNVGVGPIRIAKQISGEVSYEDLTISENETYIVSNGGILTVTGTLTNTNPDNLIIKEGGQLITSNSVKATVEKSVHASEAKTTNNWYVISSPVDEVEISSFVSEDPDKWNVYRYDETEVEWEEYRDSDNLFSTLANGRGYLYRSTKADINFVGDVNVEDAEYELTYTPTVGDYAGFHLIGNPFTHNIYKGANGAIENDYLEDGFYTLSAACAWVAGTDNTDAIAPTQAILVQAKSTADGETLEITNTTAGGPTKYGNNQIMFAVKNAEYSDVAYVLFKEGHGLNKVEHRNAEIPMLYVINNGEEFAIADMSDNTGVINLGFEAKTMGQYTISLKAEGQYSYMHLIDKLTGNDIDMLVEDSYTFVGSQSDRNDRFVLRLNYNAAGIDSESDIFAYQNGNDIIVRGEGTLQVFDITGRMVMSTRIDGVETINSIGSGVYIFRMEGKTQKIVVR